MNALKLNREFLARHLAVCILMFGIGCWFGYDGFVAYPKTPAAELYRSIEKSDAPDGFPLEAFKRQKIQSQHGFMAMCLAASAIIGIHLLYVGLFRFDWDENSFVWNGKKRPISDIKKVDRAKWKKQGIVTVELGDGTRIKLDAWHHEGVKDFEKLLPASADDEKMV